MNKRKRVILTIALGCLLSLLYITIFSLSAQDADTSTELSMSFTEKCVVAITEITGKNAGMDKILAFSVRIEGYMRKLAHFTEYAAMGFLICWILELWFARSGRRHLLNVLWISVSAAADEIHQLFVPGRSGSPWDVLLDTTGGIFGIFCLLLLFQIYCVTFRRKNR